MSGNRRNTPISSFLLLPNSRIFQHFLSFHEPFSFPTTFFLSKDGKLAVSLAA